MHPLFKNIHACYISVSHGVMLPHRSIKGLDLVQNHFLLRSLLSGSVRPSKSAVVRLNKRCRICNSYDDQPQISADTTAYMWTSWDQNSFFNTARYTASSRIHTADS